MPIFRAMAKKPRDLEAVVGRYRGPNEEVLVLNFHRRRTGAYDVSGKCHIDVNGNLKAFSSG